MSDILPDIVELIVAFVLRDRVSSKFSKLIVYTLASLHFSFSRAISRSYAALPFLETPAWLLLSLLVVPVLGRSFSFPGIRNL